MGYIFESGEEVQTGFHGQHDYVFASGEPVPDTGQSSVVFESGTGLGGGSLVVDGTDVGFYESAESHSSWWGYDPDTGAVDPFGSNAQGLEASDIVYISSYVTTPIAYITGHHDTSNDSWAIGAWFVWDSIENDQVTEGGNHKTTWNGLENIAVSTEPVVKDGPETGNENDVYETQSGVPVAQHMYGSNAGDGVLWEVSGAETITIDMSKTDDGRSFSNQFPGLTETNVSTVVGSGPSINSSSISWGWGSSITIEVST